jgi:hypothetical protein
MDVNKKLSADALKEELESFNTRKKLIKALLVLHEFGLIKNIDWEQFSDGQKVSIIRISDLKLPNQSCEKSK